jgi:thiol-disulfide isomerase/thioredoxin
MKKFLIITLCFAIGPALLMAKKNPNDAISALKMSGEKLNSLQQLSYTYHRAINNFKDNYFNKTSAKCYFDFTQSSATNPFIFQFISLDSRQTFNGTEYFFLNTQDKTIEIDEKPTASLFSNFSYFYNSIPTLRSLLVAIANNDSIPKSLGDTVIAERKYQVVNFSLKNKAMNFLSYRKFSVELTISYQLLIDAKTLFPYQVIEHNSTSKDKYNTITTFTDINTKPSLPTANSWFYTTYQNDYQPAKNENTNPFIKVGDKIPSWNLPIYGQQTKKFIGNADLKGKIVMLDFWIKNCSVCMESFPYLKALQQKYGKKNFSLVTVNAYDNEKEMAFFYKREKPDYLMLHNGQEFGKKLGIYGFPKVVIVGKDEKVIYAGYFDKELVDKVISANL